jgi:hypothetical protein
VLNLVVFAATTAGQEPTDLGAYDSLIRPEHRVHWAFQPVREPPLPAVRHADWPRNPIDAFVLDRLDARGWSPAPAASHDALLRRLYLDLIGLPPTSPRRLEVEAILDSMLAASGRLNGRMYGPSMYPHVPKEALDGNSDPDKIWQPYDEDDASRRTIYAFVKRGFVVPTLEVLDLCDTTRTCPQRPVTTVAPQALSLWNGDFVNRQARHLADRLAAEAGDDPARQIAHAYRLLLCRTPTPAEQVRLSEFLSRESRAVAAEGLDAAAARRRALEQLCRVLFNLNEFVEVSSNRFDVGRQCRPRGHDAGRIDVGSPVRCGSEQVACRNLS